MGFFIVCLCLAAIVGLYFFNNPMRHGGWFLTRRFINWFPLGMTYAFLYMGRYNLNAAKDAMGALMSNEAFGVIFAAGTWTYALSFIVNGPLVDKLGGKKGILIAAIGSAAANLLLGVLTYLHLTGVLRMNLVITFSVVYALNMYFQSYGAVSIIKVKAYWFHVRERGIFGAIFGTLISFGVYFAFDWGQAIVDAAKLQAAHSSHWLARLIHAVFASERHAVDATWAVFFIPGLILLVWALLDIWLIKDAPEDAGFPPFDTHDASSGQMEVEYTTLDLLKKVFASPVMLLISVVELTSGIFRNGIAQWYKIFVREFPQPGTEFFFEHWGLLLCMFGIVGGFVGGMVSDKFFQSRRGPPAGLLCVLVLLMALTMSAFLHSSPLIIGVASLTIVMCAIGITSLMSGTAATDLGGRKATATCSGIVDGFAYLGSGIQSIGLGYLTGHGWFWWPIFLMPFAILGVLASLKIWHALPPATRKYLAEVEARTKPA
ncbi:MAG TPA: MFS transporter [Verrucomicrobiota bacterium]|jgi:OPA family glycerol-3-phosphate transporter-like MFS transporter|nr:MFS transporter [Verrucomicrobiota bacterium]HQB15106.1 MFS transporter [Verrucomicrobiota bacterium]